jgi:hypothetical protein
VLLTWDDDFKQRDAAIRVMSDNQEAYCQRPKPNGFEVFVGGSSVNQLRRGVSTPAGLPTF